MRCNEYVVFVGTLNGGGSMNGTFIKKCAGVVAR